VNILDPLPNDRILSLLLTLQCNAQCEHCGTMSGPKVKTRLELEDAQSAIDQAAGSGYKMVVFTGGEPLMYGKGLFTLIEQATALGLPTRVVTNAFWASPLQAARTMARRLVRAGLREINFSTGDQHARFVDVDNIIRATRACLDEGLPVSVMVETVRDARWCIETIRQRPLFESLIGTVDAERINFCESPWMPLDADQAQAYPCGYTAHRGNVATRLGCDSIMNTTTVLADGRIMACCGLGTQTIPELEVGNLRTSTFAEVDRRVNDDFLKRWIKIEGPERIVAWAAEKDPSIEWEHRFAHRCQACKKLYSDPKVRAAIVEHHEEKVADVLFEEWLLHHCERSGSADAEPVPAPR
jgi:Radical SAM superfamily/4Fe-4S single cluster domain